MDLDGDDVDEAELDERVKSIAVAKKRVVYLAGTDIVFLERDAGEVGRVGMVDYEEYILGFDGANAYLSHYDGLSVVPFGADSAFVQELTLPSQPTSLSEADTALLIVSEMARQFGRRVRSASRDSRGGEQR